MAFTFRMRLRRIIQFYFNLSGLSPVQIETI
jgi:hypothetical protein